ncbi:aspartyl-phosphate phosphatase Spo0E family protein [Niallia sp. Sow4_A1]|uniref:aspartyl-phosphate phosphatase Spo0E family protein n=1 Tax=Niallia sp. Sow4_A1 TaxID=3438793 RepID=UPI003F9DADA9
MKQLSDRKLLKDIEEHREMMIYLANTTSFSHPTVVDISTKLDLLLNKYEKLSSELTIK